MKRPWKIALAGLCAAVLLAGSAFAGGSYATKTLLAEFPGIQVQINGREAGLTDSRGNPTQPFAVDGTIYVPVRALGEALGKTVEWDKETLTLSVGKAPLLEDAEYLTAVLESAHPAFALDAVPEGYEAAKAALLETAADPDCTVYDFTWAAQACAASLGDGHTSVNIFGGTSQPMLDVGWAARGNRLFLTDEKGALTEREVLSVGGVPAEQLFEVVDRFFPAENQSGRDRNHGYWTRVYSVVSPAGVEVGEDYGVELELSGGESLRVQPAAQSASGGSPTAAWEQMGDVFYVDLNQCVLGPEVDAAASALAEAVKNGTDKVILDVRGNGGGNSEACAQLLEAMGMAPPVYGGYVRYSPLAQDQRGYEKAQGGERVEPSVAAAKGNPGVKLAVLTDEDTYSSALMLAVWVRDGGLGTVVGRPSANAPSHYGDILYFTLGNSNMTGTVSHIRWLRPDQNADPDILLPDVETEPGQDILQAALDALK